MNNFQIYNKQDIFNKIDKLKINRVENQIITKYFDRVIKISNVSEKYEIFDICKYLKDKVNLIENNFNISKYDLYIRGGVQYLKLISDKIDINGVDFYKSFFILNSSDKSRKLNFNIGLYSESKNFYLINSVKNIGLTKKHLKGVTKAAEEATIGINDETFNEQIKSIKSLINHKVKFSKIREVILGDGKVPNINHKKFDAFKNSIRYLISKNQLNASNDIYKMLGIPSDKMDMINFDFYIDAFDVFQIYLKLFTQQDSHIIKNESNRIMNITQWAVRNNVLETLGV